MNDVCGMTPCGQRGESEMRWCTIFLILGLFFLSVSVLPRPSAFGEEAGFYCEQSDGSRFYYDRESIHQASGRIRVWSSVVLSAVGREFLKRNIDTKGIDPRRVSTYNEIDCAQKTFRVLGVIICGESECSLRMVDDPGRLFVHNTCPEELFHIVCRKRK